MDRTPQEILEWLGAIIEEVAGVPASEVTPEKRFADDQDVDSLRNLATVQDVIDYVDAARQPA
jgi:acyl carrier protein